MRRVLLILRWPALCLWLPALGAAAGCTAERDVPDCAGAADCGPGQLCVDGLCVDQNACVDDADCSPPLSTCRTATGECVECLADADCPSGERCVAYTCRAGCSSDGDCSDPTPFCRPDGAECVECLDDAHCDAGAVCDDGRCTVPAECQADDECDPGQICVDGACHSGCRSARDCPQDRICLPDEGPYGSCVACQADADCADGHICQDHDCVFFCSQDAHCSPQVCDRASGRCVECNDDGDCTGGAHCLDHVCSDSCQDDSDCADGLCDLDSGRCVECLAKDDCPLGHLCSDGACVPGCESDRDCPDGQSCVEGQCDGPLCQSNQDCSGATCVCEEGTCVLPPPVCQSEQDCCWGEICIFGTCVEPECQSELDCDFMQLCAGGLCEDAYTADAPYCDPCQNTDPYSCGPIENFCLIYPYDDPFGQAHDTYCAPDCSADGRCPNGFECTSVITIKQSDICQSDADCPAGLPCIRDDNASQGYCPCHEQDNPCPENSCFNDNCGADGHCSALAMSGIMVPCQSDQDCHLCTVTMEPCGAGDTCPPLECAPIDDQDHTGCISGRACGLADGQHCPAP